MLNLHLLQTKLTTTEYEALNHKNIWRNYKSYVSQLPAYLVARCPFCSTEYVERLDTYSPRHWNGSYEAQDVFHGYGVVSRCQHFVLVESVAHSYSEPFLPFTNELKVAGNLVDKNLCKAVVHALPVCQIENQSFVPRYTLFMVSYFSEDAPAEEIRRMERNLIIEMLDELDEPVLPPLQPLPCLKSWWKDLGFFVKIGRLYWIDATDPALPIRTHDVTAFPYSDVQARFEQQLNDLREAAKPKVSRLRRWLDILLHGDRP